MGKKDLENVALNINTENENLDYSEYGNTKTKEAPKKVKQDEGRKEICEKYTIYLNKAIYREFRSILRKYDIKPNRVLEGLMLDYINKNK